jgi:hypothetical protein
MAISPANDPDMISLPTRNSLLTCMCWNTMCKFPADIERPADISGTASNSSDLSLIAEAFSTPELTVRCGNFAYSVATISNW